MCFLWRTSPSWPWLIFILTWMLIFPLIRIFIWRIHTMSCCFMCAIFWMIFLYLWYSPTTFILLWRNVLSLFIIPMSTFILWLIRNTLSWFIISVLAFILGAIFWVIILWRIFIWWISMSSFKLFWGSWFAFFVFVCMLLIFRLFREEGFR